MNPFWFSKNTEENQSMNKNIACMHACIHMHTHKLRPSNSHLLAVSQWEISATRRPAAVRAAAFISAVWPQQNNLGISHWHPRIHPTYVRQVLKKPCKKCSLLMPSMQSCPRHSREGHCRGAQKTPSCDARIGTWIFQSLGCRSARGPKRNWRIKFIKCITLHKSVSAGSAGTACLSSLSISKL